MNLASNLMLVSLPQDPSHHRAGPGCSREDKVHPHTAPPRRRLCIEATSAGAREALSRVTPSRFGVRRTPPTPALTNTRLRDTHTARASSAIARQDACARQTATGWWCASFAARCALGLLSPASLRIAAAACVSSPGGS